ncbi:MAG: cytochrome c3 family protein [Desulfuromonadaceae bacterium]
MKGTTLFIAFFLLMLTAACSDQESSSPAKSAKSVESDPLERMEAPVEEASQLMAPTDEGISPADDAPAQATAEDPAAAEQNTATVTAPIERESSTETAEIAAPATATADAGTEQASPDQTTRKEPAEVSFDTNYGKVILSHEKHAEAFACALCHGQGEPGPLVLGKTKAHVLCKGCHMEQGAGPTKCNTCHEKI